MKTPTTLLATLCAMLAFAFTAIAADDAKIPGMKKAPAAAAEALKKYAADAGMKIEKVATEKHGKVTVYEAELSAPGQPPHEVAVTADGKVKGEEETVPLDKVPAAARKAIEENAKGAKIQRVQRIKEKCPSDFQLFSGDDATAKDFMIMGGHGVISVTANIAPKIMREMCSAALTGDRAKADKLDAIVANLHQNLFLEANPIPVKWALFRMGIIDKGIRLPMTFLSESFHNVLELDLKTAGLI